MTGLLSAVQDGMNIGWKKASESLSTTLHMATPTLVHKVLTIMQRDPSVCLVSHVEYIILYDEILVLKAVKFNVELKKILIDTVYFYTKQ